MVAWPLTMLDICVMSDGAAVVIFASEAGVAALEKATGRAVRGAKVTGIGGGLDAMRMADRPRGEVILLPHERPEDYKGLRYPGVHSFRAGRVAAKSAYAMAGIGNPLEELDFIELHDAYTSSEIQTYEDMGLCRYGEGGKFVESGAPFLSGLDYGYTFPEQGKLPVNPSGGLIACGHPVGATGLMQGVFALWQLQGSVGKHFGDDRLQIRDARRGAIHSHAGTGSYVSVSILEGGR
jgi:acetyl-CoA C-acetyltransferase